MMWRNISKMGIQNVITDGSNFATEPAAGEEDGCPFEDQHFVYARVSTHLGAVVENGNTVAVAE